MSMYGDGNSDMEFLYDDMVRLADDRGVEELVRVFNDALLHSLAEVEGRVREEMEEKYSGYKEKYEAMKKVMNSND